MNLKFWEWGKKNFTDPSILLRPATTYTGTKASYVALVNEAFSKNATVRACLKQVSNAFASLPLVVFREMPNGEIKLLDKHPVWDLLTYPQPKKSWGQFAETMISSFNLSGDIYFVALGTDKRPIEFGALRPDLVKIHLNTDGTVKHYEYRVGARTQNYLPEQVMHFKAANPLFTQTGLAPIQPAITAIDLDNEASAWNISLLLNYASPSLFLEGPEESTGLTLEQKKQLQEVWDRKYTGSKGAGRPVVLDGGYKVKEVGWSPKDLEWGKGKIQAQIDIAKVLGVPPELIGIQGQKTYSNYKEARKAFYEETVIPFAKIFYHSLSVFLNWRWTGEEFFIGVDTDGVEALQEAVEMKWKRVIEARVQGVLTINEARQQIGFDKVPGGDTILVGANNIALQFVAGGQVDEAEV